MAKPRLLIRLGSMGDVVLATAAANALRALHGDACTDVLVKEEWAPLWNHHPAVSELLVLGRRSRGIPDVTRLSRRLREAAYGEVVDLQASPRTELLNTLAGLRNVRRPKRHGLRRRLLVRFHRWGPPSDYRVVDAFVDAAVPGARMEPSLHPGEEARARAAAVIRTPGTMIGLVPGGRYQTKRWPLGRYVELGRHLVEQGRGPVPVFFGPDEDALLAAWRVRWPGDGTWIPVREELEAAVACLGRLAAVVSNDTGLMHAAAAVGTPVVVLFGPTVPAFGFRPVGEDHRILEVEGLGCRPCALHGGRRCPKDHFRCMMDLDGSTVAAAALAAAGGSRGHGIPSKG